MGYLGDDRTSQLHVHEWAVWLFFLVGAKGKEWCGAGGMKNYRARFGATPRFLDTSYGQPVEVGSYPIIYRVLYIWSPDFWTINSSVCLPKKEIESDWIPNEKVHPIPSKAWNESIRLLPFNSYSVWILFNWWSNCLFSMFFPISTNSNAYGWLWDWNNLPSARIIEIVKPYNNTFFLWVGWSSKPGSLFPLVLDYL